VKRDITGTEPARFLLRLPRALYAVLQRAASDAQVSLNEYCVRRLVAGGAGLASHPDAAALVGRAVAIAGEALAGVIVYGSWTRGAAGPRSDVDVLVVVERRLTLGRALYRKWDAAPALWEGRQVDPHFVHLLRDGAATGVWAEAAVDGVILFERGLQLSAALARVRRDIADGRLVRRVVHGQPYWVAA
jgi:predicted nucleotidyltransferase